MIIVELKWNHDTAIIQIKQKSIWNAFRIITGYTVIYCIACLCDIIKFDYTF